jgi:putative acetyltransferase
MITFERTDSGNTDFIVLVKDLDAELRDRDGADHAFFAQFNKIDSIKHVIVAYDNGKPVGCGAFKAFDEKIVEVKRMFVPLSYRGRGIASGVLRGLEAWAMELGNFKCVLETGKRQPEAIALYSKSGYHRIPNYGQYKDVDTSVCFEKLL